MRISTLQEQLPSLRGDSCTFEHIHLVEWLVELIRLFSIDEQRAQAYFIGTPVKMQALLYQLLTIATSCNINMEEAIWGKYPRECRYCDAKVCECPAQKLGPYKRSYIPLPAEGLSLGEARLMLGGIYPKQRPLLEELHSIIEELGEVSEEKWENSEQNLREEFADVFARFMRLVNTLGIPLEGLGL